MVKRQMHAFKSFSLNLVLATTTFFLMLGIFEFAMRCFVPSAPPKTHPRPGQWVIIPERTWIEYHSVLGWFHKRNANTVLQKNNKTIPVTTNSVGFRGSREYPIVRSENVFRIAAVGDSFTFGFGVKDDETFTHELEQVDPKWEVLNFGFAGYGIDQMYLLLDQYVYSYKPDVILISIYPEDFWRAKRSFTDAGYAKPYFVLGPNGDLRLHHVPVPQEKNFSVAQFPEIVQRTGFMNLLAKSRIFILGERAVNRIKKKLGKEDPDTSPEWLLGRAILQKMVREIRAHGIRPIFMIAPPLRWITGTDEPVRQSLLRFAGRENVEMIDLTPLFKKAAHASGIYRYYIKDDDHWTAEGHRLVAETVAQYFKEHPFEKVKVVPPQ